ncbi:MAG: SnoaL-like polyketide cyclase [Thermoleophilaceae bacterium]|jgi:ketosteroid isomerase-like protein|nr:SnoaL-like polyketide cyclase [Thermoleophilaceae bacterium]
MADQDGDVAGATRTVVPRLSERARRRRSVDQRLYARFPGLYRISAGAFMRLSPRSRLRRLMLGLTMSRAYAAANRRDFDLVLVAWDAESDYRPSSELMPPDMETVFHGHDGYRRLWRYWLDAFDDIRWEPEEMLDFGHRILVTAQQQGRGSGSGVPVTQRVFQLFTMSGGLVVRQDDFLDRAQAIEAARR